MRPALRLLLAGSLLLNLFAAGVIGGGVVMLRHPALWRAHVATGRPIRQAGDALSPDDRLRFRATMRAVFAQSVDLNREERRSRREAAELFTAPVFDAAAVDAALARARAADLELRVRLETAAVAFAAGLSTDERALLADGLARGGPLRRPRFGAAAQKAP